MKKAILLLIAGIGMTILWTGCADDEEHDHLHAAPTTTTTTTETHEVRAY